MVQSAAALSSRRRLLFWSVSLPALLIASSYGFGTPIFIVIVLTGLWVLGTREKWSGSDAEVNRSAYSVFNKGGRAIAGSTTAEDLDGQLRGGLRGRLADEDETDGGRGRGRAAAGFAGGDSSAASSRAGGSGAAGGGSADASARRKNAAEAAMRRMKDG